MGRKPKFNLSHHCANDATNWFSSFCILVGSTPCPDVAITFSDLLLPLMSLAFLPPVFLVEKPYPLPSL